MREKQARSTAVHDAEDAVLAALCGRADAGAENTAPYASRRAEVAEIIGKVKKKVARVTTLDTQRRIDGRKLDEIRADLVRGRRPALDPRLGPVHPWRDPGPGRRHPRHASTTSRSSTRCCGDMQEALLPALQLPAVLAPARPSRCAARRAARSATASSPSARSRRSMPEHEDFPYTIRVVSEILESNGSLVDGLGLRRLAGADGRRRAHQRAGRRHRDGPHEGGRATTPSCPTSSATRITSATWTSRSPAPPAACARCRWTSRSTASPAQILEEALEQARQAASTSSARWRESLQTPRDDMSPNAPRIVTVQVKPDKIRDIIGPGGKTIRAITEQTGAQIDVNDAGVVSIASVDARSLQQAQAHHPRPHDGARGRPVLQRHRQAHRRVRRLRRDPARHRRPGAHQRAVAASASARVSDVVQEGDEVVVKCIKVDRDGKIRLYAARTRSTPNPTRSCTS